MECFLIHFNKRKIYFINVTFNGGQLGYQPSEELIKRRLAETSGLTIPPKIFEG